MVYVTKVESLIGTDNANGALNRFAGVVETQKKTGDSAESGENDQGNLCGRRSGSRRRDSAVCL